MEALNAQGEEFGKARLLNVLTPCDAANSAGEILTYITRVLEGFVGAAPQHDDVTCLVVQRRIAG